jgi:UDP-N-acetylmuramoyl-tripeptide--D-alanyl-D-alanine ligase
MAESGTDTVMLRRLRDWLKYEAKDRVKSLYNPLVIALAGQWRRRLGGTVCIGITGSAGKTTTKDLLYTVLASQYPSTRNDDSNNQLYNIARTLLASSRRTRYVVQELGASKPGTFDAMVGLLRPSVALLTNVNTDHFSAFRSREAVAAEKGKLVACLPADGLAILNADDDLVRAMAADCRARVVTYGLHAAADFRGRICSGGWPERLALECDYPGGTVTVRTRLLGDHLAPNVLAVLATAITLGIEPERAAQALGELEAPFQRLSVHPTVGGIDILRDDFKSPAWSLPMVLQFLSNARTPGRRVLVLGTVSDTANRPDRVYAKLVDRAPECVDLLLLVGHRHRPLQQRIRNAQGRVLCIPDVREAAQWLRAELRAGDLLLLKGSGADHLGRLVLHLDREVRCWRSVCGRHIACDHCALLGVASEPSSHG